MGVGDIGEMPEYPRGWRDEARDGDDGRVVGKHDGGVLGGSGLNECDGSWQQCRDGIDVGDSARGGAWAFSFYGIWTIRSDGMRGDGVGVGDIGEVPCRVLGWGDWTCGGDCRGACGHRQHGMVRG